MCKVCFCPQQPTAVLVRGSTTGTEKPSRDVDRYEQQPHSRANLQRSASDFHTENFAGVSLRISVTAITQASPRLLGTLSTPATSLTSGLGTMGTKDHQLIMHELEVNDFLKNAKRIADDGKVTADGVLRYAKKHTSTVNGVSLKSRVGELETP